MPVTTRIKSHRSSTRNDGNNSVRRALRILEYIAENDGKMTLGRVSREQRLPKSSALTLLRALVSRRFLNSDEDAGYQLGIRSFEIGSAYLGRVTPSRAVAPELVSLSRELSVAAHFAVLSAPDVVYLLKEDPPGQGIKLASVPGARLPAHLTAVGKAQLAQLPAEELEAAVDLRVVGVSGRQVELRSLKRELERVSSVGFAVDVAETVAGIGCVAAPIFNDVGRCCGALGVSYMLAAKKLATEEVGEMVVAGARRASSRLGASLG